MTSETEAAETEAAETLSPAQPGGFKKKNLIGIGLVVALLWAAAITSGSVVFMSIVGGLTLLAAGFGLWVWRLVKRQRKLADMLKGAADSPEARRRALETLSAGKKAGEGANLLARAQLLAADDPAAALELLEPVQLKGFPAAMQDDLALLKAQLLLAFGRPKEARPLADWVNLDSPQREEIRPTMVAIVAEAFARTGSAGDAKKLLDSVDMDEVSGEAATQLLGARAFASFAAGKKGAARAALRELAGVDPNLLGRFVAPQARVHPGLQRLAREVAQRYMDPRTARAHVAAGRRGRPR